MSTTARQRLRRPLRHLPALLGAALLALLIPLACILDCELRPAGAIGHDAHAHGRHDHSPAGADSYTPAGHDHRLCGMHAEPGSASLAYPQALYELTVQAASGLAIIVTLLGPMLGRPARGVAALAYAPATPPPQRAA